VASLSQLSAAPATGNSSRDQPVIAPRSYCATVLLLAAQASELNAQSTTQVASASAFVAGGQELFSIDFANVPVGAFPDDRITRLSGTMAVVMKDGKRMLRATDLSEFLIALPNDQRLPENFTIEVDLVPKECCPPPDLTLEGTPRINQGRGSAHLLWTGDGTFGWVGIVGGAHDNREIQIPDEIRATLPGALSKVAVSVEGNTIRMFTNGRELYSVPAQFARGSVLRVTLGGLPEYGGKNLPVFLARVRIATGAPVNVAQNRSGLAETGADSPSPVTGIVARVDAQGSASVSWTALQGATSYFVVRWKSDDVSCCSNFSPPGGMTGLQWTDGVLPVAGSYTYRVYATSPSGISVGETTLPYQPVVAVPPPTSGVNRTGVDRSGIPVPRTIELGEVSAASSKGSLPIPQARTIDLSEITAAGGTTVLLAPAPRTVALPAVTGTGTLRINTRSVSTMAIPTPRVVAMTEIVAAGEKVVRGLPAPRIIALGAVTSSGFVTRLAIAPRVINLPGVTGIGAAKTP
jgi:hypothetical protein